MGNLIVTFLSFIITEFHLYSFNLNPAFTEMIKVLAISCSWIGGLSWFMIRKDKRKQLANV